MTKSDSKSIQNGSSKEQAATELCDIPNKQNGGEFSVPGIILDNINGIKSKMEENINDFDSERDSREFDNGFMPGVPIEVKITEVDRRLTRRLNPYLYSIQIKHGIYVWTVRRRYHHFWHLHRALLLYRTGLQINRKFHRDLVEHDKANTKQLDCQSSNESLSETSDDGSNPLKLPRFPRRPDTLFTGDKIGLRMRQLENYLRSIVNNDNFKNHLETHFFLEVSEYSFHPWLIKGKEGVVSKRVGEDTTVEDNILDPRCCHYTKWMSFFRWRKWKKIWLIVQESFVMGINPKNSEVRLVLLFDKDFTVTSGLKQTGSRKGVRLTNLTRGLNLKTWTNRKRLEWTQALDAAIRNEYGQAFIRETRFGSFSPVRNNQGVAWFVDGKNYMTAVADVIESAKEEIFIADWWLSPEIYLKRGVLEQKKYRLDTLLKRKADDGVKIYILLYKELQLALSLNSLYTKRTLSGSNIKILRHPDHSSAYLNDHLWAHHEKLVIVDQTYAFIGGIDLCYGRWDKNSHPLVDLDESTTQKTPKTIPSSMSTSSRLNNNGVGAFGHIAYVLKTAHEVTVSPIRAISEDYIVVPPKTNVEEKSDDGSIYSSNSNISDEEGTTDDWDGGIESRKRRKKYRKRKESSAIRMKRKIRSAVVKAKKKLGKDSDSNSEDGLSNTLHGKEHDVSLEDEIPIGVPFVKSPSLHSLNENPENEDSKTLLWTGKDYVNFIVKDVIRPDQPKKDNVDRTKTPRMPWHDVSVMVQGSSARDAARHFIQRWNAIKAEKAKHNINYPFLIPKSYESMERDIPPPHPSLEHLCNANCQVLRSSSNWSAGIDEVENSIETAMISCIQDAERFIYIENQFFITSSSPDYGEVKNGIGNAIFQRIQQAYRNHEMFRIYVLVPLLPAFEGHLGSSYSGNAIRAILHYNYSSICRGERSLFKRLERAGINPINYISFCSLRTTEELLGTPVTELVYIHSKLLIVDDRVVICGSANINDRSLLGNRDSEVCLMIEDLEFCELNTERGTSFKSGKYAGSLRRALMGEHLGLSPSSRELLLDPVSNEFYKDIWLKTASINSKIFDEIFMVVPNDQVLTTEECRKFEEKLPIAELDRFAARKAIANLRGNVVMLPLQFLEHEDLRPPALTKEGLVPSVTWT
nr:LOW QUALITY PROTEIN: phospholipase D1-like [Lepeophtheirus salmonis]